MAIAIILSGGVGQRMHSGQTPKQYLTLGGLPMLCHSLKTFDNHTNITGLIIVAEEVWRDKIRGWMKSDDIGKFIAFADPGVTRQFSIFNGLKKVAESCEGTDKVIIHDAARPLVSPDLITRCLNALNDHDGAMPVLPAKDTFYLTDDQRKVIQLIDRSALVAGQAPEAFLFKQYYEAHMTMSNEELLKINGSTEIAFLKGLDVVTVEGDERNIKITTPNDLHMAERYLKEADQ